MLTEDKKIRLTNLFFIFERDMLTNFH